MISRSPNLYLLMVQLVHVYSTKANLTSNTDKRQRKDFVDSVYKLVEQCLKIARDHSTTIAKNSSGSGNLDEKIVSQIKSLSLKTLHTLAEIVPSLYGNISDDKNKAIGNVLGTIINYLKDRSEHNLRWAGVSALFLLNLIENGYSAKLFKREILEIFNDHSFFNMDFIAFSRWLRIINVIMKEKTHFTDLLRMYLLLLSKELNFAFYFFWVIQFSILWFNGKTCKPFSLLV